MPMVATFELFEVQKVAANYGRLFANHVRFLGSTKPPTEGVLGVLEQFANSIALNQPSLISHNQSYGWWEIEDRLSRLRDLGFNAWSEYYPTRLGRRRSDRTFSNRRTSTGWAWITPISDTTTTTTTTA
jgi:N-acyl-D-amino-acid deacylase